MNIIEIPFYEFEFKHTFEREDFSPGIWAGTEGLTLVVTEVDLQNRTITLKVVEKWN